MKMDVPPASALALPDTRLLEASGEGVAVRSDPLVETDVGDNRHIAHDADMRRRHRRVLFAAKAAEVEVELVNLHALDQLAERVRLKGVRRRLAELLIGGPVAGSDAVEQPLVHG